MNPTPDLQDDDEPDAARPPSPAAVSAISRPWSPLAHQGSRALDPHETFDQPIAASGFDGSLLNTLWSLVSKLDDPVWAAAVTADEHGSICTIAVRAAGNHIVKYRNVEPCATEPEVAEAAATVAVQLNVEGFIDWLRSPHSSKTDSRCLNDL
ncbi:hypothetical protein Q5752_001644 [Cryptotrichosporon argae]